MLFGFFFFFFFFFAVLFCISIVSLLFYTVHLGTNCDPLVVDFFLFCYERDFMKSLSPENQADIIEAFNSTLIYLNDLLNIDNI